MHRLITGFHLDDSGDWVAELDCLHSQHVRHRPPFQQRPWVVTEAGRAERIGAPLDCPLCDRAEVPDALAVARTVGPFDEATLPAPLTRDHRIGSGTWGRLSVLEGSVALTIMSGTEAVEHRLASGGSAFIPPGVPHRVAVDGPARVVLELLRRPGD